MSRQSSICSFLAVVAFVVAITCVLLRGGGKVYDVLGPFSVWKACGILNCFGLHLTSQEYSMDKCAQMKMPEISCPLALVLCRCMQRMSLIEKTLSTDIQ